MADVEIHLELLGDRASSPSALCVSNADKRREGI
jgi:hypothetical protein